MDTAHNLRHFGTEVARAKNFNMQKSIDSQDVKPNNIPPHYLKVVNLLSAVKEHTH